MFIMLVPINVSLVTGIGNLSGKDSAVTFGKLLNSSGNTFSNPNSNLSDFAVCLLLMLFSIPWRTGSLEPYWSGLLNRLHVIPGTSVLTPLELRTDLALATSSPAISAIRCTKSLFSRTTPSGESVVDKLETFSRTWEANLSSSSTLLSSISYPNASVRFRTFIHFIQFSTSKSKPTFILFSLFSIKRHCCSLPIKKRRCRWVISSLGKVVLYEPQNSLSVCGMKNSFPLRVVVERLKLVPVVALWPHSASFTGLRSCKIRV